MEAYLASGRLEPNLHMFTNELYPPFRTRLAAARYKSFKAWLAAYRGDWSNPQVCTCWQWPQLTPFLTHKPSLLQASQ